MIRALKRNPGLFMLLGAVFATGTCLVVGLLLFPPQRGPAAPTATYAPDEFDACVMAQQFVMEQLMSPSSAEFASCSNSDIRFLGDNRWSVESYVDSQNSFGAMIRTHYKATMLYVSDNRWRLEALVYDE